MSEEILKFPSPEEAGKKRFEVKMRGAKGGGIEKAIFINGELLDWKLDMNDYIEAMKMGPMYIREIQRSIEMHFIESVSDFLGRKVTMDEIKINEKIDKIEILDDKNKVNVFSFIHPVVAALFIPKFQLLDQHMLLASIAKIVTYKSNGQELQTQPEYELYWDIATDPAETACVNKTKPFADLVNRCNVQTKLWEAVLNLRQGKYYTNDLSSFIMAIDNCRTSVFDAADLAYVKDEGTIMRKLLAAFSIRPIIVLTMPIYGITHLTSHISAAATSHITTLPMITMRLPMTLGGNKPVENEIKLTDCLSQEQLYIHHKQLTIKEQQILYSREILIFYVHRRYQAFNTSRLTNPYTISYLPITMNQFERLLDTNINIPIDDLQIPSSTNAVAKTQDFKLKSVVTVETRDIVQNCVDENNNCNDATGNKIIVSCAAYIRFQQNQETDAFGVKYNPLNFNSNDKIIPMEPLTQTKFMTDVRTNGTLYIYGTCKDNNGNLFN